MFDVFIRSWRSMESLSGQSLGTLSLLVAFLVTASCTETQAL